MDPVKLFQQKSKEVLQKEPQFSGLEQYTMRDYASLLLSFIGIGEASLIEALPNWDGNSRLTKGKYLASFYLSDGNALLGEETKQVMDCKLFEMTFFNKNRPCSYDYCVMLATLTPEDIQKIDSRINNVLF